MSNISSMQIRHRHQQESVKFAENYRTPWSSFEIEAAMDTDLTANEVAELTGRTFYAVLAMREKLHRV